LSALGLITIDLIYCCRVSFT